MENDLFNDLLKGFMATPPTAKPAKPVITVETLIAKGTSHVRSGGKIYKIVCTLYVKE